MALDPTILDFSEWDGAPLWSGVSAEGRTAYVMVGEEEEDFIAYGYHAPTQQMVFKVHLANEAELAHFRQQMLQEGSEVTDGVPPFGVDSQSSDKPPPGPSTPTGHRP